VRAARNCWNIYVHYISEKEAPLRASSGDTGGSGFAHQAVAYKDHSPIDAGNESATVSSAFGSYFHELPHLKLGCLVLLGLFSHGISQCS